MQVRKSQIAELLGVPWRGDDSTVTGIARIADAGPESLVFATDDEALEQALASKTGVILALQGADDRVLVVREPRLALAMVYGRWFDPRGLAGVHPTAIIEEGAVIGSGCEIGAGAYIAVGARIGEQCAIGPRAVIHANTRLGDRVRVQAGAVLGSDGFGYVRDGRRYIGFPQLGTLWIGDDVEIGSNTTIDRGALGETRIGRGTKIDNLVHIAHNCIIGEDVIMAAQVGIAGSTIVGDGAILGGQVGIGEHAEVGPGVIVGGQGGVLTKKKLTGSGEVFWGTPARPVREYLKDLARLRRR